MTPNIGITENNRQSVAIELSKIVGLHFYNKHKFFETLFEELDEIVDNVAERIRSLGHYAPATLQSFLQLTHFIETARNGNTSEGFIKELLEDHESIIIHLRESINRFAEEFKDLGTSDFITGLMEAHEKMAWLLRSHIK